MRSALLLINGLCIGQSLVIGLKGGVRATDDVTGDATTESKRYIAGPMVEIGLPLGLGVEFDALYHHHGYRTAFGNFAGSSFSRERANSWEFPLLLKYRLPLPGIKPYVGAGYAARTIHASIDSVGYTIDLRNGQATFGSTHSDPKWDIGGGAVVTAGVELRVSRLRLSSEFRYTHWTGAPINVAGSQGYGYQSNENQLDVLVGIGWKVH